MKKIKAIKMATGGLMSQPPYIAKQDSKDESLIQAYDVNTPASARAGLPSRAMSSSRTRMMNGGLLNKRLQFSRGDVADKDNTKINPEAKKNIDNYLASSNMATKRKRAVEKAVEDAVIKMDVMEGKIASQEEIKDIIKFYENKIRGRAEGGLMSRLKFEFGDSVKDKIEERKFEQLKAMKDSGLPLTDKQEQELESYIAQDRKVEMAIGGVVTEKYSTQRPDYQAYAEGGEVEDEMLDENMPDEDMPPMEELETEEESLLQPMGMEDEMPMDEDMEDEEDYGDMDAIIDTSALSEEEEKVLDDAVEMHPELEGIIPKLVATEFTEDGEVEGPGTGTSDSIPALLSDGEFVFTAKAVKNIGVDKLRKMMKQAEESYDAGISSQVEEV